MAVVGISLLSGCVTIEEMVPPVNDQITQIGDGHGYSNESLHHGRKLYVSRCASCHAVEPIDRYSVARWKRMIPEMSLDAKLNEKEEFDLEAYIVSARQAMDEMKAAAVMEGQETVVQ